MATDIDDLLALDLTAAALQDLDMSVLVAGDDVRWRFQVQDEDGDAVSLDGARVTMTIAGPVAGEGTFTRDSEDDITGTDPAVDQIAIDADQAVETGETGRGWFEVRFSDEDEDALLAIAGTRPFDIRLRLSDGLVRTYAQGRVEILKPRTTPMPELA